MKKTHSLFLLSAALLLSACAADNNPISGSLSSPTSESVSTYSISEGGDVPSSMSGESSLSSSAATSSNVSSSTFSSVSSSSFSSIGVLSFYDFRIAARCDEKADSMDIYKIGRVNDSYIAEKATSISRSQDALTPEEVAEYYVSFRSFPPNYFADEYKAISYGKNGRMISTYSSGSPHSYDYTVKLGTFNVASDGLYYEFDIALSGSYNTGSSISRGAGRVVVVADGIKDYGSDPVCYFTSDHYADFKEYYNFYQGWSPLFAGVYNKSGSYKNTPTSTLSRPKVPTVSYQVLS